MLRLMLLRHAKSDWSDEGAHDHDRSLNTSGWKAAARVGAHIHQHHMHPKLILCSTALRTRQTLMEVMPYLRNDTRIQLLRDLYNSSEGDYIDAIRAYGGGFDTILIVGHNTAIQDTALELTGKGNPEYIHQMQSKYPTGALAVIDFEEHRWSEIECKKGRIVSFFQPRHLQAVSGS
ncbi:MULTISPECIES: histidine phosphatase family protein [Pseudovibrio]|jgi:phosphohistidine phosphatase|uniref:Phosphohistidine phosphatase n=1 Tax=Pseudovibrio ascidiaceicola TaxID=285279 RepID=A0A1I4CAS7_9HYPH|nr:MULTISPECIES: histidine phosphatase family protein [Pseudovibrio]KZL05746.1 2,3-bisphosphoglycerate-dependent phosphoglycerate mutase [Pseudovibrio sp. Ad26]SFK78264.1 phosphohistidine phosphatase [Pseudovibrio ascidiaceicola]